MRAVIDENVQGRRMYAYVTDGRFTIEQSDSEGQTTAFMQFTEEATAEIMVLLVEELDRILPVGKIDHAK